jgi:hypothetical protein
LPFRHCQIRFWRWLFWNSQWNAFANSTEIQKCMALVVRFLIRLNHAASGLFAGGCILHAYIDLATVFKNCNIDSAHCTVKIYEIMSSPQIFAGVSNEIVVALYQSRLCLPNRNHCRYSRTPHVWYLRQLQNYFEYMISWFPVPPQPTPDRARA